MLGAASISATPAGLLALFSLAVHRNARQALIVAALWIPALFVFALALDTIGDEGVEKDLGSPRVAVDGAGHIRGGGAVVPEVVEDPQLGARQEDFGLHETRDDLQQLVHGSVSVPFPQHR